MTKIRTLAIFVTTILNSSIVLAGGTPSTINDSLTAAINSNNAALDVLSNDNSGILGDEFKEVIAVCDARDEVQNCSGNSYSDGIGTVSINGTGDGNNVVFSSNHNESYVFEFQYIVQNSVNNTSSGDTLVDLSFVEVNSLADNNENGCDVNNCTLREAMTFAANDGENSTIRFRETLNGTITLNSGLVIDSNDLSIEGNGPKSITISGNDLYRVITVPYGTERFSLSGLTISNGQTPNGENGGGILLENALETRLDNLRITNNQAENNGGGIYASSAGFIMKNTEISNNVAAINGGGLGIVGGFGGDVTIENTTVSSNQSNTQGDGIYISSSFGQNTTLKFVTAAFNFSPTIDNLIEGGGNVIIESSVFEPGLEITSTNNVTNNSIIRNLGTGTINGDNNLTGTGAVLGSTLVEINNSGLRGHLIDSNSPAYNHVDDKAGVASCGNQINSDQFGNSRPIYGLCDAGAYEYDPNAVIFKNGFE